MQISTVFLYILKKVTEYYVIDTTFQNKNLFKVIKIIRQEKNPQII